MQPILLAILLLIALQSQGQQKYNFGLEQKATNEILPKGWVEWGDYPSSIATDAHSGNYSGKITADKEGTSFGCIAYLLPAACRGKRIELKGFMKIKAVENGYAGLLIRVDGAVGTLAHLTMIEEGITGTKDWQAYSLVLDYPEKATSIYVAGMLVGKGEAWFDDFSVTVDERDIEDVKTKALAKAELDKEFNKGSGLVIGDCNDQTLQNLELLGKVWGFLKYHHPAIAEGNYNWDYELFRFLPHYLKLEDTALRDQALVAWIDQLGPVKKCTRCKKKNNSFLLPNQRWIEAQNSVLRERLWYIYNNRSQGDHYYIQRTSPTASNPTFKKEKLYARMPYPDDGVRLLALFRYWNIVHYFFPYRHLMDRDWELALGKYLPLFLRARNELEYELVLVQMIATIQDSHAYLSGGREQLYYWKGSNYPPFRMEFIEEKLVVVDYYDNKHKEVAELEIGTIITAVNGVSVSQLIRENVPYYPASNTAAQLRDMANDLLRSKEQEITITFINHKEETQTKPLQLYTWKESNQKEWLENKDTATSHKMLENNIGYINLATIKEAEIPMLKEAFENTKGLVLDLRNYPKASIMYPLGSFLVSSTTDIVKFTEANLNRPGEFVWRKGYKLSSEGKTYTGKVMILVNEQTQSFAEYLAMAFSKADRALVVGSQTAGADGNVSLIPLPGNLKTRMSAIGMYYPDGRETQRVGVKIDVEIQPTVEGIRAGRDELLEKAIELIEQ